MAAGNASQTTSVGIMHVFVLCCTTQIVVCTILIPVKVLLRTWCVLINNQCEQLNCCVWGTFPGISQLPGGLFVQCSSMLSAATSYSSEIVMVYYTLG